MGALRDLHLLLEAVSRRDVQARSLNDALQVLEEQVSDAAVKRAKCRIGPV